MLGANQREQHGGEAGDCRRDCQKLDEIHAFILLTGALADRLDIGAPHHRIGQRQIDNDSGIPADQRARDAAHFEGVHCHGDHGADGHGDRELAMQAIDADRQRSRLE